MLGQRACDSPLRMPELPPTARWRARLSGALNASACGSRRELRLEAPCCARLPGHEHVDLKPCGSGLWCPAAHRRRRHATIRASCFTATCQGPGAAVLDVDVPQSGVVLPWRVRRKSTLGWRAGGGLMQPTSATSRWPGSRWRSQKIQAGWRARTSFCCNRDLSTALTVRRQPGHGAGCWPVLPCVTGRLPTRWPRWAQDLAARSVRAVGRQAQWCTGACRAPHLVVMADGFSPPARWIDASVAALSVLHSTCTRLQATRW
jgi:hypothetical protein